MIGIHQIFKTTAQLSVFSGVIFSGSNLWACQAVEGELQAPKLSSKQQFSTIYEPSGLVALPSGEILIIEDESHDPLSLIRWGSFQNSAEMHLKMSGFGIGKLEDLEGIATDETGHVYVTTSHTRTLTGKLPNTRKKLVRFDLVGSDLKQPAIVYNLRKKILKKYKSVDGAVGPRNSDLNIEALSFHRAEKVLLIGLRWPVIDGNAVVIRLENPENVFSKGEKLQLAREPVLLDLDKGGIRAMAYDKNLGGYLIISRREDKKDKPFKLWLWDGAVDSKPARISLDPEINLNSAEGITPVRTLSNNGILVVRDSGDARKRRGGQYVFLTYDKLKIENNVHKNSP